MNLTHDQAKTYLEQPPGRLRITELSALQQHLDTCEECRIYQAEFLRRDRHIQYALQSSHPRPQFTHAELQRISTKIRFRVQYRRFFAWLGGSFQTMIWAGLTAAMVFGLTWLFNRLPANTTDPAATAITAPLSIAPFQPVESTQPPAVNAPQVVVPPSPFISPQLHHSLTEHRAGVTTVAYSPDGQLFASSDSSGMVNVWNTGGDVLYSLKAHEKAIASLVFSPDSKTFVTGGKEGQVKLWDSESGKLLKLLLTETSPIKSLAFSPSGNMVAIGMSDSQVAITQIATGLTINYSPAPTRFDISTDTVHHYILASSESAVWLDSPSTIPFAINLRGQTGRSLATVLAEDGRMLASSSTDNKIYVWLIYDVTYVIHDEVHHIDTTKRLVSGPLKLTLEGHTDWVHSLAFTPDMQHLISGSADGTIKIWSLTDGTLEATLTGHTDGVNSIALSPDGLWIASASDDNTINIWSTTP